MRGIFRKIRRAVAFTLVVALTASLMPAEYLNNILPDKLPWMAKAAEIVHSGIDVDLEWSIDSEGCLKISGSGDYSSCEWTSYYNEIKTAVVDVDNITSTRYMFDGCSKLTSLDLTNFDTSNVTNMSYMFRNCSSLASLDLSNFDTSSVTNMGNMFRGCNNLNSLELSRFNTSSVTDMNGMFSGCSNLTSLDLTNFDTSSVKYLDYMFQMVFSL